MPSPAVTAPRPQHPVVARHGVSARLTAVEWYAACIALLIAHAFLAREWFYPSSYDAGLYAQIGREIAQNGLFHPFSSSDLRTYGYPLFLSVVHRGALLLHAPFTAVLFETQLLLYATACLGLRNALFRFSPLAARIAFCATLCNYYVLVYLPESLTESASATLLLFATSRWIDAYGRRGNLAQLVTGSLAVGFALMVRPGNLFMLAAWIAGLVVIGVRDRPRPARLFRSVACVTASLALPLIPQVVNNAAFHGKHTPLVVLDLGHIQQVWGIQNLKYATAMPPVSPPAIYYHNPLYLGTTIDEQSPWRWYFAYPVRGALTLALHAFNLTDQDLLFTYSRDLAPWYRVPLGIVNHAAVALGVAGLFLIVRRTLLRRDPFGIDGCIVLLLLLFGNLAVYVWTAVEMRFGSVLLLALFPAAAYALLQIANIRDLRKILVWGLAVAVYVVCALQLSDWVRSQSDVIRQAWQRAVGAADDG